jgi:transposase InsO family protein
VGEAVECHRSPSSGRRARVTDLGLLQSASTRGPEDNAYLVSFFHSLKAELIRGASFTAPPELRRYLRYYNNTLMHSALGYRSPVAFEAHAELGAVEAAEGANRYK